MSNSIAAFREAKRKQEEEELKKKLEMRRKKMEEQKNLMAEEERKERELRESRKKMSAADIEKQRKAELAAMAEKLEAERRRKLEEEIKKQEELEKKREAEREAAMKAEVAALMNSSKKVGEIVTSPQKKALLSPRGKRDEGKPTSPRGHKAEEGKKEEPKPEPKKAPRPVKQITEEERQRRLEKLNSEGAMRQAEAQKAAAAPKTKMLKRAETVLFRQPAAPIKKHVEDDRKMKDVPKPISAKLDEGMIFDLKGVPNPDMLKIHFLKEGRITIGAVKRLVNTVRELSAKLPNILELPAPMVVVGDIHGQFYDLVNMMRKAGNPKEQPYLFLGDYVDRGMFNIEVVLYLFACKLAYPKNVFLLRGNHEGRQMTNHYNFRRECVRKYSEEVYQDIMKCFDALPICAVVTGEYGKFFCTHGGLSPFIHTLEDISNLDRFQDVPTSGALCDLLWSDPVEEKTFEDWQVYDLNRYRKIDFDSNPGRNLSFTYGYKFAKEFCEENNFVSIVRGHEVQKEGFMRHWFGKEDRKDPLVITVFSAPNYTDTHGNKGAYLNFTGAAYTIETFEHEPHPFVLPNFQDGISFSLPFIAENTTKIFAQLVAMMSEEDEDGNDEIQQSIKKKLNFLLRTVAGYKLERIEREEALKESQAPAGATFETVTQADAKNEQAPAEIAVAQAPKPTQQSLRMMQMKRSTSTGTLKKFF